MIYLSLDIEASGPFPGIYSLVSIGAVPVWLDPATRLWSLDESLSYYVELKSLPDSLDLPAATRVHGLTREYLNEHGRDPLDAMESWRDYLKGLYKQHGRYLPAAWPASFDCPYVGWYAQKFLGENPLGYKSMDIASYAQGTFRCGRRDVRSHIAHSGYSKPENPYPHNALKDAVTQGKLLAHLLNLNYSLRQAP